MFILTVSELEFLAGLNTSWRRLYWNELARLLKEDDNRCGTLHEAHAITAQPKSLEWLASGPGGKIVPFVPAYRECDKDLECQDGPNFSRR